MEVQIKIQQLCLWQIAILTASINILAFSNPVRGETIAPLPQITQSQTNLASLLAQTPGEEEKGEEEKRQVEPRVLVAEVLVVGELGELEERFKDLVYKEISTKPGRTTTRSQLQEDVNAVYATGFFRNVRVTPADTPLGVRISFLNSCYPHLG